MNEANIIRYHGKCLKIARGKVKEDEKYTCPICDWRVKIPRDAARPKLEDLQQWQDEIAGLPFQPDEEDILDAIINNAQDFRTHVAPFCNPIMATSEEADTQRFYLRKIEGAEILLAYETNFFRQELHKWSPVAPEAPPVLENSKSTRKPRPTKLQKLMAQHGVDDPEALPQALRTKQHSFKRKSSEPTNARPQPLQPAPGRSNSGTPTSHSFPPGSVPQSLHHSSMRPEHHGLPAFSYDDHPYNMASNTGPNFGQPATFTSESPRHMPLDPGIFTGAALARPEVALGSVLDSPMRGNFPGRESERLGAETLGQGSGIGMESMFSDLTNQDDSQERGGDGMIDPNLMTERKRREDDEPMGGVDVDAGGNGFLGMIYAREPGFDDSD